MIGTVLGGRLELKRKLGAGAMAEVFLGVDKATGDKFAVKVLAAPQGASADTLIARFKREFLACARLDHPNVIKLYSFGQVEGGGLYYSMDFLPWPDLEELLKQQGKAQPEFVLNMAEQMASAFSHYHAMAVVHRDLKPANILVSQEENKVIITDFGLARDLDRTRMTATGVLVGSPLYMSPELITGQKADLRSDIYQLGVIAYEALSGKMPFHAKNIAALAKAICLQEHVPIDDVEPSLPPQWTSIIDRCLEKEPDHRYQSGDEILEDLRQLRLGRTIRIVRGAEETVPDDDDGDYTSVNKKSRRATLSLGQSAPSVAVSAVGQPSGAGTGKKNGLIFGTLTLVCIILAYFFLRQPRNVHYSMSDLRCQTGVQSMTITWQSERPYISRVQIQAPEKRLIEGEQKETKKHKVVVSGLKDNTEYTFRILYPSGETSLPQRRKTERLHFRIVQVKELDKAYELLWQSTAQARSVEFRLITERTEKLIKALEEEPGRWKIALPKFAPHEPLYRASALLQLPGAVTRELDLAELLRDEIKSVGELHSKFDERKLVEGLDRILTPDNKDVLKTIDTMKQDLKAESMSRKSKAPKVRQIVQERMAKFGAWKAYDKAVLLSPMVLPTKLVSFEERLRLFRIMQNIYQVAFFLRFVTAPLPQWPEVGVRGPFALTIDSVAENMKEVVLLDSPEKPLKIGLRVPITRLFGVERWEKSFILQANRGFTCAELAFQLKRPFNFICMRVKVNGLLDFIVYDCRQMPKPLPKAQLYKTKVIYQQIPVEALRQGENVLLIEAEPVLRPFTRTSIPIEKLTCRYLTK